MYVCTVYLCNDKRESAVFWRTLLQLWHVAEYLPFSKFAVNPWVL